MDAVTKAMIELSKEHDGLPVYKDTMVCINKKRTAVTYLCLGERMFYKDDGTAEIRQVGKKELIRIK
jgi:hypothetical protein